MRHIDLQTHTADIVAAGARQCGLIAQVQFE